MHGLLLLFIDHTYSLDNKEPSVVVITIFIIYKSHISKRACAENYVLVKQLIRKSIRLIRVIRILFVLQYVTLHVKI